MKNKTGLWAFRAIINVPTLWYVQSGDGLNKPFLLFKQNQVNSCKWCNWQVSIYCFQLEKFLLCFWSIFGLFSTFAWLACWPTVDRQVTNSQKWESLFTITARFLRSTSSSMNSWQNFPCHKHNSFLKVKHDFCADCPLGGLGTIPLWTCPLWINDIEDMTSSCS